jgi:Na+:H+ antiporter, NhaA family
MCPPISSDLVETLPMNDLWRAIDFRGGAEEAAGAGDPGGWIDVFADDDHTLGDALAPVTLVFYGNYVCPRSAQANREIDGLVQRYGSDRLRVVFRHLPRPELDPAAELAAEAAEIAASKGEFWGMHKRLMEAQHLIEPGFLTWHAAALGLDIRGFEREMNLRTHAHRATRHAAEAQRNGIHMTPTFIVNGLRINGDLKDLSRAIKIVMAPVS